VNHVSPRDGHKILSDLLIDAAKLGKVAEMVSLHGDQELQLTPVGSGQLIQRSPSSIQ